jgi:hypothetical protein
VRICTLPGKKGDWLYLDLDLLPIAQKLWDDSRKLQGRSAANGK